MGETTSPILADLPISNNFFLAFSWLKSDGASFATTTPRDVILMVEPCSTSLRTLMRLALNSLTAIVSIVNGPHIFVLSTIDLYIEYDRNARNFIKSRSIDFGDLIFGAAKSLNRIKFKYPFPAKTYLTPFKCCNQNYQPFLFE